MVKVSNSGTTDTEKTEHDVAAPSAIARSQSHHNRHTHLPAIPSSQPSPPPPHDDEEVVLQFLDVEETSHPLPDTPHHSPPPPPSKKTFYDKNNGKLPHANNEGSPTFLKRWMARYPILARHPRRFVALLFTFGTLLLLFIILLSIRLSQGDGSGDSGGGGWIGDSRGGTFPIDPKTEQDLRKHNRDLTKPPINRSNEPGWTSSGRGDGTYYGNKRDPPFFAQKHWLNCNPPLIPPPSLSLSLPPRVVLIGFFRSKCP
jgi:hypothetical protein